MGYIDYKAKQNETSFGKYWPVFSVYFTAIIISEIFTSIMGADDLYSLNVILGYVIWFYIANTVSDCCYTYDRYRYQMQIFSVSFYMFILRDLTRLTIPFIHCLIISCIFIRLADFFTIFTIPIMILVSVIVLSFTINFAFISAMLRIKFPDYTNILNTLIQGLFFITPIVWITNPLIDLFPFFTLNPLFILFSEIRHLVIFQEFTFDSVILLTIIIISSLITICLYRFFDLSHEI